MKEEELATSTIGELFDIGAGKTMSKHARDGEHQHPFLRTSNIGWGRVDVRKIDTMSFSDEELRNKTLRTGDLLVCEGGEIGKAAVWNDEIDNCGFQNHLHRLRSKSDEVVPRFYMYYLQAGFTQLGIYEGAGNKTTIPNLSRTRLEALRVPEPDQTQHTKIAAVLWKVQRAIEVEEKLVATARELKRSAMHQLFTRGLRSEPQKETEIGIFPESWKPIVIRDLGDVVTGSTPKTSVRTYYEGGSFQFIAPGDLGITTRIYKSEKFITEAGLGVSRVLPRHTVCFVCIGSSIGKVGITTVERCATNQQINAVIANEEFDPFYVCFLLEYLSKYLASFTSPSPVPILSKGTFQQIPIFASVEIEEQENIARALMTIDDKIEIHERKRATLQELFKTLLHKLMTGEIRVADLDIDTSEVTGC